MPILFWFFQPAWITSAKLLLGDSFKVNALNIKLPWSCHQSSQLDTSTDSASLLRKSLNWCWAAWYSSGVVSVRMGKTSATNFSFNSPNSFAFRLTESLKWNSHPNFVLLDVMSFFLLYILVWYISDACYFLTVFFTSCHLFLLCKSDSMALLWISVGLVLRSAETVFEPNQ